MKFLGRHEELATLEREYFNNHSFVVIYGRRRIGKTTLIKEFIKNKKALYFLADIESERQNMKILHFHLYFRRYGTKFLCRKILW